MICGLCSREHVLNKSRPCSPHRTPSLWRPTCAEIWDTCKTEWRSCLAKATEPKILSSLQSFWALCSFSRFVLLSLPWHVYCALRMLQFWARYFVDILSPWSYFNSLGEHVADRMSTCSLNITRWNSAMSCSKSHFLLMPSNLVESNIKRQLQLCK